MNNIVKSLNKHSNRIFIYTIIVLIFLLVYCVSIIVLQKNEIAMMKEVMETQDNLASNVNDLCKQLRATIQICNELGKMQETQGKLCRKQRELIDLLKKENALLRKWNKGLREEVRLQELMLQYR